MAGCIASPRAFLNACRGFYERTLRFTLRHSFMMLALSIAVLGATGVVVQRRPQKVSSLPRTTNELSTQLEFREGISYAEIFTRNAEG